MNEKEILISLVEKTLGVGSEQVPSLLYKKKDDGTLSDELDPKALETLLGKDKERVALIKSQVNTTEYFDNGYKKAQAEVLSSKEKALKEKYSIEVDAKLEDLVPLIISSEIKKAAGGDMEESKVKSHPLYIQAVSKVAEVEKTWEQKLKAEIDAREEKLVQIDLKGKAEKIALQALDAYNPVLSSDAERAKNQRQDFLEKVLSGRIKQVENVGIVLLNDKGEVQTDTQSNVITIGRYAEEVAAKTFDKKVQQSRQSAGNGGGNSGGSGGSGGKMPTTQKEYADMMFSVSLSAKEKAEIKTFWEKQKG